MQSRRMFLSTLAAAPLLRAHEDDTDPSISLTAMIHGNAGPFAVAGYRMGMAGLRALQQRRFSFDLEVVHYCPRAVQWSCILDGLQAATGASPGKLNLRWIEAPQTKVRSVIRNRKTGQEVSYALTADFLKRYVDTPVKQLAVAGAEVSLLEDAKIFRPA